MRSLLNISALVACISANTIPRWIKHLNGDTFCKWQAVSFVFMGIAAARKTASKCEQIVWDYTIVVASANAIDEWMGLAQKFRNEEIVFGTLVTLWTIYRLTKCQLNHNT